MTYSFDNPRPRYTELRVLYRAMHEPGEPFLCVPPEQRFPGTSLPPQATRMKRLVDGPSAWTMDYGGTRGREWPSIVDYWDVDEVVCYDPCYPARKRLPNGENAD